MTEDNKFTGVALAWGLPIIMGCVGILTLWASNHTEDRLNATVANLSVCEPSIDTVEVFRDRIVTTTCPFVEPVYNEVLVDNTDYGRIQELEATLADITATYKCELL